MGLRSATAIVNGDTVNTIPPPPAQSSVPYTPPANKDMRILYQGLTQAALQSMPLGQFAPDLATHLMNVKAAVEELAAFILEKSR